MRILMRGWLVFVICTCCGCAHHFAHSDFYSQRPLESRLAFFNLVIDEKSFGESYAASWESLYYQKGDSIYYYRSPRIGDRGRDAIQFLRHEISEDIIEPTDEKHGTLICRVDSQTTYANEGWRILAIITLGIPNILGVPVTSATTKMQLEFEFLDQSGGSIKEYSVEGKGTAYCGLRESYYGGFPMFTRNYDNYDIFRAANLKAISNALQKIKPRIESDRLEILQRIGMIE